MFQEILQGGSGGSKEVNIISGEERVIGKLDGKTLYSKTIVRNGSLTSGGSTSFSHGISNLDLVFSIDGTSKSGSQYRPITFAYATTSSNSAWYSGCYINGNNIVIESGSSYATGVTQQIITLVYTKTS